MEAGKIRHKIVIERLNPNATPDAAGHIDETDSANWEAFWRPWANLIPRNSREFIGADRVQADITHQIEIRYSDKAYQVSSDMRVKYGNRRFNILSEPYDVDERRVAIRFDAKEIR